MCLAYRIIGLSVEVACCHEEHARLQTGLARRAARCVYLRAPTRRDRAPESVFTREYIDGSAACAAVGLSHVREPGHTAIHIRHAVSTADGVHKGAAAAWCFFNKLAAAGQRAFGRAMAIHGALRVVVA